MALVMASVDPYTDNWNEMDENNSSPRNWTEKDDRYDDYYPELRKSLNIISVFFYSLAFVLGVMGNGVVIWVTGFKMKKTVNTVWFLNLAVADFLFTAFLPLKIAYTAMDSHWPFGKFMCKVKTTLITLNMFASVYILVVISVDRCISVVKPIWARNHRSVQRASAVSLVVWFLALVLSSPYFVFRDITPSVNNSNINCFNNFASSDDHSPEVEALRSLRHCVMIITRVIFGFVVPFAIIVSCNAVIIHRLRKSHSMSGRTGRPFRIIVAVITAFFVCWAPFHIMAIIEMINHTKSDQDFSQTLQHVAVIGLPITLSLAFLNSCLNPLLYVFMGQDFKDEVRKSILKVLETAFTEEVHQLNDNQP